MSKKTSLAAALKPLERGTPATPAATPSRVKCTPAVSSRSRGRVGKKSVVGYFDPGVSKQIKRLALDRDISAQELLREALNDLFQKYKMPTIA